MSAYGTMGQGGNVWEWTETTIRTSRVVRGGVWGSGAALLNASYQYNDDPAYEDFSLGFRVGRVPVPEPDGISLLVGGAVAVLIGWGRWGW
ncbi:MAG: hypothetical protein A2W31_02365 [Planctomycetes bacterium RBG_16_64_10]|nr:MAG: hypothetical protein A2W31_02365 [Planctomycetes bacterium RBG_16_64_10]